MIRMRTLLMTLAFTIGLGAMAQNATADGDKKTVTERAASKTAEMTAQLGLTPEQSAKVGEINLNHMKNMEGVKGLKDERSRENRERILKDSRDRSFQTVLTPEQYTKMMQLRAEKKEAKKPHNE
jgi:hypothetical protein